MSRISNSFTVANAIVDLDLRNMSGNALKCYVVIVRKTTGWNKTSDRISISQFQEFAGIAKRDTVGKALRELEEMGLIIRHEKIGKITEYSLNFDEPTHPEESQPRRYTKKSIDAVVRKQVFERDKYRCRHCGDYRDLTVDHIIPESKGGAHELENFQTLCRMCNSKKGVKNPQESAA